MQARMPRQIVYQCEPMSKIGHMDRFRAPTLRDVDVLAYRFSPHRGMWLVHPCRKANCEGLIAFESRAAFGQDAGRVQDCLYLLLSPVLDAIECATNALGQLLQRLGQRNYF